MCLGRHDVCGLIAVIEAGLLEILAARWARNCLLDACLMVVKCKLWSNDHDVTLHNGNEVRHVIDALECVVPEGVMKTIEIIFFVFCRSFRDPVKSTFIDDFPRISGEDRCWQCPCESD